MKALLERGKAAYLERLRKDYRIEDMPMGAESISVVLRSDFVTHAETCLDYAAKEKSLFVMEENGMIFALVCRHRGHLSTREGGA